MHYFGGGVTGPATEIFASRSGINSRGNDPDFIHLFQVRILLRNACPAKMAML
jgi:hypothetical protein